MKKILEKIYARLNLETDGRVCTGISDDACNRVVSNYFLYIINGIFTQVADTIANPKTVLSWFMNALGVPLAYTSLIVPIRESGSMMPQFLLSEYIKTRRERKNIWMLGAIIQSVSLIGIGMMYRWLDTAVLGLCIVLCVGLFSLGRSLCSISSKDLIGKTIPKSRRGKLTGYTNMVAGIATLIIGFFLSSALQVETLSWLIIVAGILWLLALLVYGYIYEPYSKTQKDSFSVRSALDRFSLLKTDATLRKFIIVRGMLLCSALTTPFYVTLAQDVHGSESTLLGYFIIATGFAGSISAGWWGRQADISSRKVLVLAALISSLLGILVFVLGAVSPSVTSWLYFYPLVVFILSIAHAGVRIGRKTYIIDIAEGDLRTDYVAISNTVIGLVLLLVGAISAVLSLVSVMSVIVILSLIGIIGAILGYYLPEVSHE